MEMEGWCVSVDPAIWSKRGRTVLSPQWNKSLNSVHAHSLTHSLTHPRTSLLLLLLLWLSGLSMAKLALFLPLEKDEAKVYSRIDFIPTPLQEREEEGESQLFTSRTRYPHARRASTQAALPQAASGPPNWSSKLAIRWCHITSGRQEAGRDEKDREGPTPTPAAAYEPTSFAVRLLAISLLLSLVVVVSASPVSPLSTLLKCSHVLSFRHSSLRFFFFWRGRRGLAQKIVGHMYRTVQMQKNMKKKPHLGERQDLK